MHWPRFIGPPLS